LKSNPSLSENVLATIKLWEEAKADGAFSSAQKRRFVTPSAHLNKKTAQRVLAID
jgi:hypothetical protein